jgi:hypothetical protein
VGTDSTVGFSHPYTSVSPTSGIFPLGIEAEPMVRASAIVWYRYSQISEDGQLGHHIYTLNPREVRRFSSITTDGEGHGLGKGQRSLSCCCLTHRLSREQRDGRWCESLDAHGRSVSRSQLSSTIPLQGDGGRSLSVALHSPRFPGGWQIETFIYSLPNRRWTGVYVQYAIASLPESKLMALTTNVAIQQADGSGTVDGLGTGNAL